MAPTGYFIDANLLVLFVVGGVDRNLIAKHRRLREYTEEDYDVLLTLLNPVDELYVTPNTLTETSNLLGQHAEPERSMLLNELRGLIQRSQEVVVSSAQASNNREFPQLGLSDAALLEAITPETPLLTVDLDLFIAALQKGYYTAINFSDFRDI